MRLLYMLTSPFTTTAIHRVMSCSCAIAAPLTLDLLTSHKTSNQDSRWIKSNSVNKTPYLNVIVKQVECDLQRKQCIVASATTAIKQPDKKGGNFVSFVQLG